MENGRTALVLGASGGIGGEVAASLLRRGWKVRGLHRKAAEMAGRDGAAHDGIAWVQGDAMNAGDVLKAARGVSLIVHAVNPPGYRDWDRLVLPMMDNTIAAARATGARILLPGTVYNYGPDAFPVLSELSPQNPLTRKGKIRVQLEQRLRDAATAGIRSLVVRAGDFYGPRSGGGSWFSEALIKPGRPVTAINQLGDRGIGHAWAYLPDLAETMVRLIERDAELAAFETFHFAGHWDGDGTAMVRAIRRATGKPGLPVRRMLGPLIVALSPFVTTFREMLEMRYLWREPVRLDNSRLVGFLGAEPHTPLDEAVRISLTELGCLKTEAESGRSVSAAVMAG